MSILSIFRRNNEDVDWRDIDALPAEVVSKNELDQLQDEVVSEIEKIQRETVAESGERNTKKPQSLYYYHKFIDSKFNKRDFDIDTYFMKKQNIIDRNYADGLAELKEEFTDYKKLINEIREVDQRLRRKTNALDPESNVNLDEMGVYDDEEEQLKLIQSLPSDIDWNALERSNSHGN